MDCTVLKSGSFCVNICSEVMMVVVVVRFDTRTRLLKVGGGFVLKISCIC